MCNLYRLNSSAAAIADMFKVEGSSGMNLAEDVYPGYPGMVVAEGRVRAMAWGFPLALKGKQGHSLKPKPVNSGRADKRGTAF